MTISSIAAGAYAATSKIGAVGQIAKATAGKDAGGGFGAMLEKAIGQVAETGRAADQKTQAMAAGKADIVDVVTAVAETEVAIETLVSVRDRVIQAYEEIMRMPI
jgi:flagellar hook-basal body complex protein FliE